MEKIKPMDYHHVKLCAAVEASYKSYADLLKCDVNAYKKGQGEIANCMQLASSLFSLSSPEKSKLLKEAAIAFFRMGAYAESVSVMQNISGFDMELYRSMFVIYKEACNRTNTKNYSASAKASFDGMFNQGLFEEALEFLADNVVHFESVKFAQNCAHLCEKLGYNETRQHFNKDAQWLAGI